MDNPVYLQWQQWETRVREWLDEPEDELEQVNIAGFDRVILTLLTVKYQMLYRDMDKENEITTGKKCRERKHTIKLFKTKAPDRIQEKECHRDKEKMFDNFTGRFLTPEQAKNETSTEWEEFNQLYEWHGLTFLQRIDTCLSRFISELISTTPEYQELIQKPAIISPVTKIDNRVYHVKKDGQAFLSVDMKSANFAMLQYIHAIDAHKYPTWPDFLSLFLGSKPLLVQSKKLRMYCLGQLPEYHKLQALWTHYTASIYKNILCRCFDENDVDVRCVALSSDEVVFHLDTSIKTEQVMVLVDEIQKRLTKENSIVKFVVQVYRLRAFHWQKKHMCFARMFIGQDDKQFDLKCVPNKDKNYEQAYADYRMFSGL